MVQYLAREFVNSGACKIAEYSRVLSAVASILNLLAVTLERSICQKVDSFRKEVNLKSLDILGSL